MSSVNQPEPQMDAMETETSFPYPKRTETPPPELCESTEELEERLDSEASDSEDETQIIDFTTTTIFDGQLHVIEMGDKKYLIGREMATLLNRETFNMYRSMKGRKIKIKRANSNQLEQFAKVGAVKNGTHSVTLVPYQQGLEFINEVIEKEEKRPKKKVAKRKSEKSPNSPQNEVPQREDLFALYLMASEILGAIEA